MQRAHSLFVIKSADDDTRVIEGIATTPVTDRAGDIVESAGGAFSLPLPFLWQHDKESPIGHVTHAKVTDEGIVVRVQVERDEEPGPLKDLLDKSWRMIKKGLVRGLSIGFKPIEAADIKGTFGTRFTKWDWLELSAVTIAANQQASIHVIKSIDAEGVTSPRSGTRLLPSKPNEGTVNYAEQIKTSEATRAAKAAEREAIQEKTSKEGRTKDAEEQDAFDGLTTTSRISTTSSRTCGCSSARTPRRRSQWTLARPKRHHPAAARS